MSSQPSHRPKVSVCVVTYNQAAYIAQCLDSLVGQQTDFDFEVVVFDDCSTDATSTIVADFARQHGSRVRHVRHEKNLGAYGNYQYAHEHVDGKYVVHMDGDDYALPGKLQVQADYLDDHPDCQIVWHPMKILDVRDGSILLPRFDADRMLPRRFDINDLVANITIGLHSSKMYRRWERKQRSPLRPLDFGENVLHLHEAGGYAAFVSRTPLGVYRVNIGISTGRANIRASIYQWLQYFYDHRIADRHLVFAKVLWMLASDAKHRSGSFSAGLRTLLGMPAGAIPFKMRECRARRVPQSVETIAVPH